MISLTMCWRFPGKPVFVKASMNAAIGNPMSAVCKKEPANKADFLTVHGLWPGLPKSIAARGVDQRR
ncbi:ribonuclease I, partial [Salmonella enterica subsp. enterica serovar Tennessee str. TXSC_TXSC08-21]